MTNLDTLMNSSLAAVAETDFQPFTDLAAGRQRKVLSVRNLSKAYQAQHKVLDGISTICTPGNGRGHWPLRRR